MGSLEIDKMNYSTDALAAAAYLSTGNGSTPDSYTKLLSHFDGSNGATAYSDIIKGAWTFASGAKLSTAAQKFGTASLLLNGSSDYLQLANAADFQFGTGDFTVDAWVNLASTSGANRIWAIGATNATSGRLLYCGIGNTWGNIRINFGYYNGSSYVDYTSNSLTINTGTWYHIAVVRYNGYIYIYQNGASVYTATTCSTDFEPTDPLFVGCRQTSSGSRVEYLNGYVDELRVSKGIARWTNAFTPDAASYPIDSGSAAVNIVTSEATIKTEGAYSIKVVAPITASLNSTLTKTFTTTHDLTGVKRIQFDVQAYRIGSNFSVSIIDDVSNCTTTITPNITTVNTFQTVSWDISGVADVNKAVIDRVIITILNADVANTIYLDNFVISQSTDVFGIVN